MDDTFLEHLSGAGHLGPEASAFMVLGVLPAVFLFALVTAAVLWWRARSQAGTANDARGQTIVSGTVEADADLTPGVRLEIRQRGTEWTVKNGWNHRWEEISRRTVARPF
ncbi:MAG: hypothetical protein WCJ30_16575, partial [Deltaproteobacteria bacterium]